MFKGHAKRPDSWPGWKVKGQGQTRTKQAFEMGVLETYFFRFVKRPVARFLHLDGLKIRFMPSHKPHCPIVLILGQRSNVTRKDQIRARVKGQRTSSNANDAGLWNGRPGNIRFVKRPEARFPQFGGLKIRFMPSNEPHSPIALIQGKSSNVMRKDQIRGRSERSKVKVKRERHMPLKWASWKRTFAVSWNDL